MSASCEVVGCDRAAKKRGLCGTHYMRVRRHGDAGSAAINTPGQGLAARFWSKVDRKGPNECWPWTSATNDHGYGVMRPEGQRSGPTIKAHRVSLILAGRDPGDLKVLHSCDNPPCVNPNHLRVGTQLANVDDMVTKERQSRGSGRPLAKLTEADVPVIRRRLDAGHLHRLIASDFGVSRSCISRIASGAGWRHVPADTLNAA